MPDEILQFLRDHIDSVEQLEMLVLLCQTSERAWTADEMARELRSSPVSVAKRLDEFSLKKFVKLGDDLPKSYQYGPSESGVAARIAGLCDLYKIRRYSVIDAIFSKPVDKIKVFADAFKLRKD